MAISGLVFFALMEAMFWLRWIREWTSISCPRAANTCRLQHLLLQ